MFQVWQRDREKKRKQERGEGGEIGRWLVDIEGIERTNSILNYLHNFLYCCIEIPITIPTTNSHLLLPFSSGFFFFEYFTDLWKITARQNPIKPLKYQDLLPLRVIVFVNRQVHPVAIEISPMGYKEVPFFWRQIWGTRHSLV